MHAFWARHFPGVPVLAAPAGGRRRSRQRYRPSGRICCGPARSGSRSCGDRSGPSLRRERFPGSWERVIPISTRRSCGGSGTLCRTGGRADRGRAAAVGARREGIQAASSGKTMLQASRGSGSDDAGEQPRVGVPECPPAIHHRALGHHAPKGSHESELRLSGPYSSLKRSSGPVSEARPR